jgi:nicotinamide-nucleotide amidase
VCFCVTALFGADQERVTRSLDLPGSRGDIRDRSTAVAFHLLRRLLRRESAPL